MNNKTVPLSKSARALILGTLLGDGSLKKQKGYANARLQMRHSVTQVAYFNWKVRMLAEINGEHCVHPQKPDGYSKNVKLHYASRAIPALTALYEETHKRNALSIRRTWLNTMTPLSLAVWWCDDGSLIGEGGRKGVFCTDGFDKRSVQVLAQYLRVVWGIRAVVAPVGAKRDGTKSQYWRLWIRSSEELKKFLRLILPHIHTKDMLRKTLLRYKDPQFLQRWISEVVARSGFSEEEVRDEYAKFR
jgi:hypothetical protein